MPIRDAWIAAGVSGTLVFLALLALVALVYWRRARRYHGDADTQALEDGGEQDPISAPAGDDFAAISYNVTPPLPPPEDDEEEEEDGAQHWSNGVILIPESHPILM